ncbi:glycine, alanine and asparagine-rich protein isoform X2 [Tribolium castaneum]|uniref:Uncharacterized protein n=1 Tax=Tribolium castaneum TaxID=7070 RepID=D6W783_TRICA|nr:PREDICTED: glycine, alanine and asparagine-rich protein isoform X2 [Tribolium castaneum]XP_973262.1 PREDICTED: glycine, alanine and asparagine-rich protein isoform X2 [Tribolium castaneum]EFA11524.2 hypothetical protein TcasGA2_TC014239 [Tribolium castaneum]|eukprot:XP_015836985.1 PREDICTED: glycine, alanine and asparagine-rich protein isoform X2 [Tribolium castaneum]
MRLFFLTIALSAGCLAQEYEELELYNNYDEYGPLTDAAGGGGSKGQTKLGFSAGSGLRSIAEGSFNSANDAVNNQDAAGHQAAFVAKNTLAQAAAGASATAQAALAGKQILLQGLEQQLRDAQTALMGEKQQLMQAQRSADATMRAAQEARAHVNVLTNTLNAAQTNADHMTQAASEAAGELAAQQSMVGSAKQRVDQLSKQLASVRIDFEATRAAAQKAQAAAQAAAANAAAAAAAAAADLAKSAPSPAPSAGKGGNGGGGGKGSSGGQGGKGGGQGGKGASAGKYIQGIEGNVAYVEDNFYHPFHYSK